MRDYIRRRADRKLAKLEAISRSKLTTAQHILHLLLTIFTCGLWIPVWIIRAIQGNKVVTP